MSLLALLENIDSEYISIEELLYEIQQILGENKTKDDAITVLMEMLRREKEFPLPIVQYKDLIKGSAPKITSKRSPFQPKIYTKLKYLAIFRKHGG